MSPSSGEEHVIGMGVYEKDQRVPSVEKVEEIKTEYRTKTGRNRVKFQDRELYRKHSALEDLVYTYQCTENTKATQLNNPITSVETQSMLRNSDQVMRQRFMTQPTSARECTNPVTPKVEKNLANIFINSGLYLSSVPFVGVTNNAQDTMVS